MNKMPNNLMLINKIIIFVKNIIDEDVDTEYFTEKIIFDLNFINNSLDEFWSEYLKFIDVYKKENFIKSFSFSLKRFYNLLNNIKNNKKFLEQYKIDNIFIDSFIESIQEKINLIAEHNSRQVIVNTQEQCINEEEYQLLLNNTED